MVPTISRDNLQLRLRRAAYTLLELVVVMIILAVIASVTLISVSGHLHQARLRQAADRLEALDTKARDAARRAGQPVDLVWDTRANEVKLDGVALGRRVKLGRSVTIDEVRASSNERRVSISPVGQSDSYAVRLIAKNGSSVWLVTLGLTGQHLRVIDEEDARALVGS